MSFCIANSTYRDSEYLTIQEYVPLRGRGDGKGCDVRVRVGTLVIFLKKNVRELRVKRRHRAYRIIHTSCW